MATVASLPVADQVPIHGVPVGPREASWRATAPHELFWVEALDGGNPVAKAAHRDRLMRLRAPFTGAARGGLPGRAPHRGLAGRVGRGRRHAGAHPARADEALAPHLGPRRGRGHLAPLVRPQRGRPLPLAGPARAPPPAERPVGAAPAGRRRLLLRQRRDRPGRPPVPRPAPPEDGQGRAPVPVRPEPIRGLRRLRRRERPFRPALRVRDRGAELLARHARERRSPRPKARRPGPSPAPPSPASRTRRRSCGRSRSASSATSARTACR